MIFVGIDNGLNGGIVAMDDTEMFLFNDVMPILNSGKKSYDINKISKIFDIFNTKAKADKDRIVVMLEEAYVRPISGKKACFSTGFGYGLMQGLLIAYEIPYEIIRSQMWMKELGINSKGGKGSIAFCKQRFPNEKWTATDRSKKPHDGKTDACGLALFGLRKYSQNTG